MLRVGGHADQLVALGVESHHVDVRPVACVARPACRVALLGLNGLRQQASQGQRADFERFICQVPDVSAQEGDEISSDTMEFGHVLSNIVNLHLI